MNDGCESCIGPGETATEFPNGRSYRLCYPCLKFWWDVWKIFARENPDQAYEVRRQAQQRIAERELREHENRYLIPDGGTAAAEEEWTWQRDSDVQILCLGCKREFPGFPDYNAHHCSEPGSGEAYK